MNGSALEHIVKPWYKLTVTLAPRNGHTMLLWDQEFESSEFAPRMRPLKETANKQVLDPLEAVVFAETRG